MKIAFVIFTGMTALDFVGIYDPLTRLKTMGFMEDLEWEVCAFKPQVHDQAGLTFTPTQVGASLEDYDLVIIPGGKGTRELVQDRDFIAWIKTAAPSKLKASVCTGALLLGSAGFLSNKRATTHPSAFAELRPYCRQVLDQRIVDEGDVITAGGVTSSIDLGLYMVEKLAGGEVREQISRQMDYHSLVASGAPPEPASQPSTPYGDARDRAASIARRTNETQIHLTLNLDGSGKHQVDSGIGFLDHMLSHLAVHGLFDLALQANGDLNVDSHHTVEDIALALGQAFSDALGDRSGIFRMASVYVPMDEALARVVIDFSGRPYAVIEAEWNTPAVGGIPTSLFPHFLESFAMAARCNLHAHVLAGRDDHHIAEALFKALGRALDAATRIDSRRAGNIPSTKGTLTT